MKIDKRLLVCADMVKGDFVCDIGTDHGYLPAYLIESGKCRRAIAADINKMPLDSAIATFEKAGITDKAQFILSDGLKDVPLDEVTDIVIAGMGGELISQIISADERSKQCGANFILQPMTRAGILRRFLAENGFETVEERAVSDGKFVYSVIMCRYTGTVRCIGRTEENIGLVDSSCEDGKKYILRQLQRLESAANGISSQNEALAEEYKKLIAQIRKETGL